MRGCQESWANYLEKLLGNGELSLWTSAKVRECYSEVEEEDEVRQSIVQDILRKWSKRTMGGRTLYT